MSSTKADIQVCQGRPEQLQQMLSLFPRLADFSLPERRVPEDLWSGDAKLLERWAKGDLEQAIVLVALDQGETVVGVSFAQMRAEALSGSAAAHLEVLAVAKTAEGRGVGSALMAATEQAVKDLGANYLTLNVFSRNTKARGLYQKLGFDEELIRCIKALT